jgi:cell division protein FtsB
LLEKFLCLLIDLSSRSFEVTAQAATHKSSLKAKVDNLVADNSLLKTEVDSLAAEVAQLKADQAKAQELLDKH